jgi:hypothetical protein
MLIGCILLFCHYFENLPFVHMSQTMSLQNSFLQRIQSTFQKKTNQSRSPVETPCGDPESVDVVTLIDSTEPVGILFMVRPDKVIVNWTNPGREPAVTVSNITFVTESGAAADSITAPPLITTGVIEAKNPAG